MEENAKPYSDEWRRMLASREPSSPLPLSSAQDLIPQTQEPIEVASSPNDIEDVEDGEKVEDVEGEEEREGERERER